MYSPKMLIAEDNEILRDVFSNVFNHDGFDVQTACNAAELVFDVTRTMTDVIVLDLGLPDVLGLETIRYVRNTSPFTCIISGDRKSNGSILAGN